MVGAWILLPGGGTGNWKDQSGVTCGLSGKYDQGSFQKAGLAQLRHGGNRPWAVTRKDHRAHPRNLAGWRVT